MNVANWAKTLGMRAVGTFVSTFIGTFGADKVLDWAALDLGHAVAIAVSAAVVNVIIPAVTNAANKLKGVQQAEL